MSAPQLLDLQKRAETLSATRDLLRDTLATMQAGMDVVKAGHVEQIRKLARQIAKQHNELAELISQNPNLFVKPRTHVADGLKYGMQKQPGKLTWPDDAKVVAGLRRLAVKGEIDHPQLELLINVKESPNVKALEKLDARLLKMAGVSVGSDTDAPLIKSVDSEVEKAVNAVIRDVTKDANAEVKL